MWQALLDLRVRAGQAAYQVNSRHRAWGSRPGRSNSCTKSKKEVPSRHEVHDCLPEGLTLLIFKGQGDPGMLPRVRWRMDLLDSPMPAFKDPGRRAILGLDQELHGQ